MKRATCYLRVSTDKQGESGLGLEAQEAAVRAEAARLGLELATTFRDVGLSGSLPLADRPGLLDAVAELRRGDVLLVARRDRLGRDVVGVALIEREVARRGARIVSAAGEASELEGPTGSLVRTILDAVAEFERASTALRTRAALRAKRARGERAGGIPWGFRLGSDGRSLEPEPREVEVVALARAIRAEGVSIRGVCERLGRAGVKNRAGNPPTLRLVATLLARAS